MPIFGKNKPDLLLFLLCLPNLDTVVKNKFKSIRYRDGTIASCLVGHTGAPTGADKGQKGDITSYITSDQERTKERVVEIGPTENRYPKSAGMSNTRKNVYFLIKSYEEQQKKFSFASFSEDFSRCFSTCQILSLVFGTF